MKTFLLLCLVFATVLAVPKTVQLRSEWMKFRNNYNKNYNNAEAAKRFSIFKQNLAEIERHNQFYEKGVYTYRLGINQFADMTKEEFVNFLNTSKASRPHIEASSIFKAPKADLPESVDWRNEGVVTPVKNQGQCGSCWAFSATGALESQNALKTGNVILLSEQELVDCSERDGGCAGGFMNTAFEYVRENGLTTEEAYPYEAVDGICRRGSRPEAVRDSGYVAIASGAEDDLVAAVATQGPISVAVDASNWHLYQDGIFNGDCGSDEDSLNHGVLAVGYEPDSWLVKNSWSEDFGENGYIRLQRNVNKCGIATDSSYPILNV